MTCALTTRRKFLVYHDSSLCIVIKSIVEYDVNHDIDHKNQGTLTYLRYCRFDLRSDHTAAIQNDVDV
jgi:hypothetical protein